MMIDCAFFEKSRNEVRTYKGNWLPPGKQLRLLAEHGLLAIVEEEEPDEKGNDLLTVRGSHMMNAGNSLGLAQVNERFNISLPEDIDHFYRMYNGGYLLFRELYRLLSVDEIIQWTLDFRTGEPRDTPYHIVRFCDLGDSQCLALRLTSEGNWVVMYAEPGYTTEELLNDEELIQEYTWDNSFTDWLKRMCETDGFPVAVKVYGDAQPALKRL